MNFPIRTALFACVFGSLVAFSAAPEAFAQQKKSAPAKSEPVLTGGEWTDPAKYRQRLAQNISRNFKTWSTAEVDKFLKDSDNRSDLAAWALITACRKDDKELADLRRFTKKSATRRFLAEFVADTKWIEGYLYSAPPENPLFALQLLNAFVDKDPEIKTVPEVKKIATGVAGEFSRRGWFEDEFAPRNSEEARKKGPSRIYRRFKFFAESWREGRLNKLFDELDYWDTRIVVGTTGRTNNIYYGHEDSLLWAQNNARLPEAGYASGRDIFAMPYRLWSKLGDSVHSGDYYAPFREWYGNNQMKITPEVGAVCGGISHYGATAACANGIPGVTMGEPGHCAFAVRVAGKWRDNNSVNWKRSLHWRLWDETSWEFLHLTQSLYEDPKNTRPSFRIAALASLAASGKKTAGETALSLYEYATEKQPLNFPVWREYLDYAKKHKKDDKAYWLKVHGNVIKAFLPAFPDVAAVTLCKHVYPTLLPLLESSDEKISLYVDYWKAAAGSLGAGGRWDWESVWLYQEQTLADGAGADAFASFRKSDAGEKGSAGGNAAQQSLKKKLESAIGPNSGYAKWFEKWKNGEPRDAKK